MKTYKKHRNCGVLWLTRCAKHALSRGMNRYLSSIFLPVVVLGGYVGATASALEVDSKSNSLFDLYFFDNDEEGMFGTPTGTPVYDTNRQTSGHVKDSGTYYWNDQLKQAMISAVNTWTSAISTPYDSEKHSRKLRIGFFLDDATTPGGQMTVSMAGYASVRTVVTKFEPQYGAKANIYSVPEWVWRDNNETDYYHPSWVIQGSYWEDDLLAAVDNSIDMAIVLNPIKTSFGYDAQGQYYRNEVARTAQELQNVATHEIGHGMGMDSRMYTQRYDAQGNSVAMLSGYVSTWDSLLTLNGEDIVRVEDGKIVAEYSTLPELQAAGWECGEGLDPLNPDSYTGDEIQYDPERQLSLQGEIGVHIAAVMLEGDTMEHLAYGDGTNVLGPGGTANSEFSATDLQFLEMVGWQVNYVPEPSTATLSLLALAALAARRRRASR